MATERQWAGKSIQFSHPQILFLWFCGCSANLFLVTPTLVLEMKQLKFYGEYDFTKVGFWKIHLRCLSCVINLSIILLWRQCRWPLAYWLALSNRSQKAEEREKRKKDFNFTSERLLSPIATPNCRPHSAKMKPLPPSPYPYLIERA